MKITLTDTAHNIVGHLARKFAERDEIFRVEIIEDVENDECFSAIVPANLDTIDECGHTALWDVYGGNCPILIHFTGDLYANENNSVEKKSEEWRQVLESAFQDGGMYAGIAPNDVIRIEYDE